MKCSAHWREGHTETVSPNPIGLVSHPKHNDLVGAIGVTGGKLDSKVSCSGEGNIHGVHTGATYIGREPPSQTVESQFSSVISKKSKNVDDSTLARKEQQRTDEQTHHVQYGNRETESERINIATNSSGNNDHHVLAAPLLSLMVIFQHPEQLLVCRGIVQLTIWL